MLLVQLRSHLLYLRHGDSQLRLSLLKFSRHIAQHSRIRRRRSSDHLPQLISLIDDFIQPTFELIIFSDPLSIQVDSSGLD